MKYSVAAVAFAAAVSAQTPPGCSQNFEGTFEVTPANVTLSNKRAVLVGRAECQNTPVSTLEDGVLTDQEGRTGGIVANSQFQYDLFTQPDSVILDGFSICENGTLAAGGSAIFWSCISGTFSNLYTESQGEQCSEVYLYTNPCEGGTQFNTTSTTGNSTLGDVAPSGTALSDDVATTSAVVSEPVTSPTVVTSALVSEPVTSPTVVAPFPVGNETTASATGSAPAPTGTDASTTAPVPFDSGASLVTVGGSLFAAVAGLAALAML